MMLNPKFDRKRNVPAKSSSSLKNHEHLKINKALTTDISEISKKLQVIQTFAMTDSNVAKIVFKGPKKILQVNDEVETILYKIITQHN